MTKQKTKTLLCGDTLIEYELIRKKVKNINLRVRSDCTISVSANTNVSEKFIEEFIQSKSDFIIEHLEKFKNRQSQSPTQRKFVNGENFKFLGENLSLKVIEDSNEKVYHDGVYLYLHIKDKSDFDRKQKMIEKYYDQQCSLILTQIATEIYPIFAKYDVNFPTLKFRTMKSRWGSCCPGKCRITLNKRLIEKPKVCIEYVVLHEYSHFIHPNHSKQFYDFVAMFMPDWKARKKLLEIS